LQDSSFTYSNVMVLKMKILLIKYETCSVQCTRIIMLLYLCCLISIQQILQTVIAIFRHSNKSLSADEINELRDVLPQLRNSYGTVALNKDEWDELEKYVNR